MTEELSKRTMLAHELLLAQTASKHLIGDEGHARGINPSTQLVVVRMKDIEIVFETDITSAPFKETRAASVSARGHVPDCGDVIVVGDIYFDDGRFSGGRHHSTHGSTRQQNTGKRLAAGADRRRVRN